MSASTGWKSRFEVALQTRHRIVLYGNTEDFVLEDEECLPICEWLRQRLIATGCPRVVRYNHSEEPRALAWESNDLVQAQQELIALLPSSGARAPNARTDPADPQAALRVIATLLRGE